MVLFPLEENIINFFLDLIIYKYNYIIKKKYILKYLMSEVSSLAIICFAEKCQVKSRMLLLAKPGWKVKVHLAQDGLKGDADKLV